MVKEQANLIKEQIREILQKQFVENLDKWNNTLKEINWYIIEEIKDTLILSNIDSGLLFDYNTLCQTIIKAVNEYDISGYDTFDSNKIANELTTIVIDDKIIDIITYYIRVNKDILWGL